MKNNSQINTQGSVELRLEKRGVDKVYGHLNNSYFDYYFEKVRVYSLKSVGLDDNSLKQEGLGLFVRSKTCFYNSQLTNEQIKTEPKIRVSYKVAPDNLKIIVELTMYHQEEKKATETLEHCFVNLRTRKPVNMHHFPGGVLRNLSQEFHSSMTSGAK